MESDAEAVAAVAAAGGGAALEAAEDISDRFVV
jgi:hypothetical protein